MLQHLIGMSEAECKFLHLIACASIHSTVRSIMSATRLDNLADAAPIIAMLIGEDEAKVVEAMKADGLLSQLGLFVQDKSPSCLHEAAQLAEWCYRSFAEPHASTAAMMGSFIEAVPATALVENDFPHLAVDLAALTQYLNGVREKAIPGINILIYGKPGTGKTEFSKVLAKQLGAHLYAVPDRYSDGVPILKGERLKFLQMSERFLHRRKGALILFDEIDDVFPENGLREGYTPRKRYATSGKAWMNRTLEMNQVPVIWISNHAEQIDPAYLRRFSYHLEIRTPPLSVRQRIAERYLEGTPVSSGFIQQIACNKGLTPALIENAAKVVSLSGAMDEQSAEGLANRVIRQCQAVMGLEPQNETRRVVTHYSLDYLNLDCRYGIDQIVSALQTRPSSSLCFYGLPGTGKTALAEHIADSLGRPLIAKRASDLMSKWLGESEKNIAAMFREASAEQGVLLLDEADSFLRNREGAQKSWEVSQVNELLQQMERFDGVFICATNLFAQIDAAALRRFAFKIAFKAMLPEQRVRMFVQEALASDEQQMNRNMQDRLNRLESLVPGDFAVVNRQSKLMGVIPTPEQFLDELESECREKPSSSGRTIGFLA